MATTRSNVRADDGDEADDRGQKERMSLRDRLDRWGHRGRGAPTYAGSFGSGMSWDCSSST